MKMWKYLLMISVLALAVSANADVFQTYDLAWSGVSFGNNATATGQITLDLSTLPNPSGGTYDMYNDIVSMTLTISGATSGDGTWSRSDLAPISNLGTYTYWDTGGATLNMLQQLVGQPTTGNPWGTPDGISGDFNFFFTNGGPIGTFYFTMTTAGGNGDQVLLTSVEPVPEPGTMVLAGSGLMLFAGSIRRKLLG